MFTYIPAHNVVTVTTHNGGKVTGALVRPYMAGERVTLLAPSLYGPGVVPVDIDRLRVKSVRPVMA